MLSLVPVMACPYAVDLAVGTSRPKVVWMAGRLCRGDMDELSEYRVDEHAPAWEVKHGKDFVVWVGDAVTAGRHAAHWCSMEKSWRLQVR
jgi:hypothetical protein